MTKHFNPSIAEDASRIFNFKGDFLSSDINDYIVPVIPISRVATVSLRTALADSAGPGTILTTPTDRDFYLTGVTMSVIKSVGSTSLLTHVQTTINGVARFIIAIDSLSVTAQSETISQTFNPPLKIDRGVVISINNNTAVASIRSSATITGFFVDVDKPTPG